MSGSQTGGPRPTLSQVWLPHSSHRYTALTELQIKPNPKNAKETAVAVQHEGERVLKASSCELGGRG